jgi:FkbM family methyltransferase
VHGNHRNLPIRERLADVPMIAFGRRLLKGARLLADPRYRRALIKAGVGAAIEHEGALRGLGLASLVDVGANVGQFSAMAKGLYPSLEIHAFEPLHGPAAKFQALFAEEGGVRLHRVACGDAPGEALIHVSRKSDSSSLLPISPLQTNSFPGTEEVMTTTINVVRADDVVRADELPRPCMVKLDVQGFELAALRGMPRLLMVADYVYAEVSFRAFYVGQPLGDELIRWLSGNGFAVSGLHNVSYAPSGETLQADLLFSRAG